MHLLVRETRTLDAETEAVDLGQSPADLILLSFSDSDLGAAALAWEALPDTGRPTLRLANLARLRHPMSVDLYLEQVVAHARCVVVRLLGGLEYWRYGAEEVSALCRAAGIALALLPGDARGDEALASLSTVGRTRWTTLSEFLAQGGPENLRRALLLASHLGGAGEDPALAPVPVPDCGELLLEPSPAGGRGPGEGGATGSSALTPALSRERERETEWARAAIVFYRSHLQAGDIGPIEAMAAALSTRGLAARAFYVASLKDPACAGFVAERLAAWKPDVVLNATAFSARQDEGGSPLDASGAPVLQLVLSGSGREAWAASSRGLSATDLAMHVVLPELDGRLLTASISFKQEGAEVPGLGYARSIHCPDSDGIALAADRAAGWARLARTPACERRIAVVLSNYPGSGRVGHAVGLDTFASLEAIVQDLGAAGYGASPLAADALVRALCHAEPEPFLRLAEYRRLFAGLPDQVRDAVHSAWGDPETDDSIRDGAFGIRVVRQGNLVVAVQPDRGSAADRKEGYHDPDRPPRHPYLAFYLWLRRVLDVHAILHLGAHGTLEWLPGKSAALSPSCFPAVLTGGLPVIYPFIANNPGEAGAAKRRLGAVTIGHLTPPLRAAGLHGEAAELERLVEEYAAADGMDRRRPALLRREILERAESAGLLHESGAEPGTPEDDRLARLDAYLCDLKEAQIRDGLHIFGRDPAPEQRTELLAAMPGSEARLDACAPTERTGLVAALSGRFVQPGPAGAPTRSRADVLPTGRNLFTTDPRLLPTRTAVTLAEKAASELLRRHLQDQGEPLRAIVLNLWGSTTMRTGGEDLALALLLLGTRPTWDAVSARLTGFEIVPLALLDRPRVDVTLRISGLFRDAFAGQIALFDAAVRAVAEREEARDWNPLAGSFGIARVYGPAPGAYGAGTDALLQAGTWEHRAALGRAYLSGSGYAYRDTGEAAPDPDGFARLVGAADAFVATQDHRETDVLEGTEWAAHAGGFAALAEDLGHTPALYHADTGRPDAPRIRTVPEEVARMVRARAANPVWIEAMRRHGYRGGAEIARAVEALHAFAACLPQRLDRQFDVLFEATLAHRDVDAFLRKVNPEARADMAARFADAQRRGLWQSRRNDTGPILRGEAP